MSKDTYWMCTPADGTYAQVEGAAERDRLIPLGWQVTGEPAPTDFVYMSHEGIELPGRFPVQAVANWRAMGWTPCGPPEPVDLTKDPQPPAPAAPAAPIASSKPAAADKTSKE